MESGKSPGTDGLPAEFYKMFWNDVSTFLIGALNMSFSKGYLSISQRRGLITLLPTKNKPRQDTECKYGGPLGRRPGRAT